MSEATISVAIHGATGRMGLSIARVLAEAEGMRCGVAVDRAERAGEDLHALAGLGGGGPVVGAEHDAAFGADVVIDFSLPAGTAALLAAHGGKSTPLVIGTTGLDAEGQAAVRAASERAPVVFAPNYSQGVTVLFHLAREGARAMGAEFDAEIFELHHHHKVDSPSGTAVRLAEVVAEAKGLSLEENGVYGREGQVGARPKDEIGVLAMRGGDIVGEHTLFLAGAGERLELTHRATDRAIFARGAVRAARWATTQPAGLYDMFDVMGMR